MDNVFVLGLDDFNRRQMERRLDCPEGCRVHGLLGYDETEGAEVFAVADLMGRARQALADHPGPVDALVGYWDFPVSLMLPLLCREQGLRGPSLESVLRCEHKFWSRLEQARAVPECVPRFCRFDPFAADPLAQIDLPFPFWIKPIKSFEGYLGFRIGSRRDFARALGVIRPRIGRFAEPFDYFLGRAELPAGLRGGGGFCLAEELIGGRQCTVEGWVQKGIVSLYATTDSLRFPNRSSFQRYQYPSRLPRPVQERMAAASRTVIPALGLDDTAFNIEYFWDPKRDVLRLLEINPRMVEEHADLYWKVDGASNHQVMVDLALGRAPRWRRGAGGFRVAGKFFLRRFRDGVVTRVPTAAELAELEADFPGAHIFIWMQPGQRLSEQVHRDSYSYKLGSVFLGAASQEQLLADWRRLVGRLPLAIAD